METLTFLPSGQAVTYPTAVGYAAGCKAHKILQYHDAEYQGLLRCPIVRRAYWPASRINRRAEHVA